MNKLTTDKGNLNYIDEQELRNIVTDLGIDLPALTAGK